MGGINPRPRQGKIPKEDEYQDVTNWRGDRCLYQHIEHLRIENLQCKKPPMKLQLKCHFCSKGEARRLSAPLHGRGDPAEIKARKNTPR